MADRYWVGGTGTWDATSTTNWSASSGGAGGASAPTSADNVIFDANSNTLTLPFTVTVGGTNTSPSVCNDFTTGGGGGALDGAMTLAFGGTAFVGYLDCHGSMTLPVSNLTVSGTVISDGPEIRFAATTTGKTITTNGVSLALVTILRTIGVGGEWTLGSALTANAVFLDAGTFNTANYNCTIDSFRRLTNGGSTTLTLGSSTITSTFGITFTETTNFTLNAGTSQINISANFSNLDGGGFTYYNVSFTGFGPGTRSINGSNTFNNLTFTSRGANGFLRIALSANQTISGALTLGTANTGVRRIKVESDTIGTQRTITCNGTLAALSDIDFRDINAAGTVVTPWTGTRIGNCLGNSNITFTAAADKYWNLAAGGNWNANAWSLSSGGAVDINNFPLAQDKVIIENTGLNTSALITINANWNIGELDISTRTNAMTLRTSDNVAVQFYKNITLSSAVTTTVGLTGNSFWSFVGQGTTQILDVNTATIAQNIVLSTNLTLELAENTTCSQQVLLVEGTLNLNDKTLTCDIFLSSNTNTRVIAFGTGNITVTGNDKIVLDWVDTTNFTYTGTPTFNFTYSGSTGTRIFNFGSAVSLLESNAININITAGTDTVTLTTNDYYKNINFTGFAGTLTNNGRTIFGNLTIASGMTLTAGDLITILAATSGTQTITSNGKTLDFPITMNGVGGTVEMADALTIGSTKTLTLNAGTIKFKDGTTNSAGTFVIEGSSGNQVVLNSTSGGTQYTLSQSSGFVIAKFANIKDSIGTGGANYIANLDTNINGGNTTNWLFTSNNLIFLS
jgi:hypothetical protein